MKKGFTQIVIIAAATLLISAGLIFSFLQKNKTSEKLTPLSSPIPQYQTDEITKIDKINWKTYTDPDIDFTFEYPNNFEAKSYKSTDPKNFEIEVSSPDEYRDRDAMRLRLIVAKNTQNLTLEKYLRDTNGDPSVKIATEKKEFVKTNTPLPNAFSYIGNFGGAPSKVYVFLFKDTFYTVTLYGGTGAGAGYTSDSEKIYDQILSTFKFVE